LLLCSEGDIVLQSDETTDLANDAQFMVFVRYRATDAYVEHTLLCRPLVRHTTGEEMLRVDSSFEEHQLLMG